MITGPNTKLQVTTYYYYLFKIQSTYVGIMKMPKVLIVEIIKHGNPCLP